mgnify:CR=1 FL=1|tara:strand:- start:235 stop:477 length:243 start_codon:yes stop_codon:yes gene_type:complete
MDKRRRRLFILTLLIEADCWNYKEGDIILSAVISNNKNKAMEIFSDRHSGSEYPFYEIINILDTRETDFFMPNVSSENLM